MTPVKSPKYAMSIDVEDYFQVWAFSNVIAREQWDAFDLRVETATHRALDLFDRTGTKSTFFTLGWVAERAPQLVREIVSRGHEIASHGYDHVKIFDQSRSQFREDAGRTKKILEDCAGVAVTGYRAAGFSLDNRSPWAHEVLDELGYCYSSSQHPIAHDHYGDPNGARTPYLPSNNYDLVEAPVATAEFAGRRFSAAGGGWFRAAPYAISKRLIEQAARSMDGPVIFYFHPWEIDADQPRVVDAPLKSRIRHYLNLSSMENKLERLLRAYPWRRIDETLSLSSKKAAA